MINQRQDQDRAIRVFVSSTFRDMQEDRDQLVLRIFPQIRRLCEERGVTWGEVDLRWGISDEQQAEGKVLPICLEEIRRCRPYFIGLLGERYGWIPKAIPPEVIEHQPWLREHVDDKKSVTELEILHGVLNNPEMADHAFFYFRDPKFVESLPEDRRDDFTAEDAEGAEKLKLLKENIRQQHRAGKLKYEPREDYRDVKALGERVLADFTALIDSLFPAGEQPSPLERERMDHEAFARSRAGVYIGRQEYFDRLDAHAASDGPPLVVLGESGGGKSALLANWALRHREQHPDDFVLLHFIGSSPDSANATGLLRRIMLELKQRFDLPDEVPAQPEKIRKAFPDWLTNVAGEDRIVLVLDALNQLENVDAAPDLGWLPRVFPKYCRVIVSTLPGRCLEAIQRREWLAATPSLEIQPLDEAERRLIREFLSQYSRDLGQKRTDRLVSAQQTANPLYLRVLLDELRVFGVHQKLNERIDWYLETRDPRELYRKVILRWEEAYADGMELVRDVLSLLKAARRGLSEAELLDALGQQGRPLPHAVWSPLYLAMSAALVTRSGLMTFAHDFLSTAARDECLPTESDQQAAHQRLNFQRQTAWTDRRLDELPWQLAAAAQSQQLHDTLTDQACFLGLQKRNKYELLGYWLQLKPQFDLAASYTAAFSRWDNGEPDESRLGFLANKLAHFLDAIAACHTAAEPLYRRAVAIFEKSRGTDHPDVATCLNNLATLLKVTNHLSAAEPLYRRALAIHEESFGTEHPEVAICLNNLALLLLATNRLSDAEPLMRRALAIDEQSFGTEHPKVASRLNNLAALYYSTNRMTEAEPLMRRVVKIYLRFTAATGYPHPHLQLALGNYTDLLETTGASELDIRQRVSVLLAEYGVSLGS